MIRHIVLLAFKKDFSNAAIQEVFSALEKLTHIIPQIRTYTYGECQSPENLHKGFLHGFVMDFDNAADRNHYLEHPEHQYVANEVIAPALENGKASVLVFDYLF